MEDNDMIGWQIESRNETIVICCRKYKKKIRLPNDLYKKHVLFCQEISLTHRPQIIENKASLRAPEVYVNALWYEVLYTLITRDRLAVADLSETCKSAEIIQIEIAEN